MPTKWRIDIPLQSTSNTGLKWKIFWADLDPVQGSEQAGKRPVLVVSNEIINEALPVIAVLPLTTVKPGRTIYPTEALLTAVDNQLPEASIAMAHQVRTLAKSRLLQQCGEVTLSDVQEQVQQALRIHLDL